MNHDNHYNAFNRSDGKPALLAIADPLDKGNTIGIIEYKLCRLKINAMLFPVAPILRLMPLKSYHVYLHNRKYIQVSKEGTEISSSRSSR
jgi:hypothetical protein